MAASRFACLLLAILATAGVALANGAEPTAAEFAAGFYRSLRLMPVADALAAAQRQMAGDRRYANPYYWAGYTLSGDGRPTLQSQVSAGPSVSSTKRLASSSVVSRRSLQ